MRLHSASRPHHSFAISNIRRILYGRPPTPFFRKEATANVRAILARAHNYSPQDERAVQIVAFNDFMKVIDTLAIALRVLPSALSAR